MRGAAIALLLALFVAAGALAQSAPGAVIYIEHPEGGPMAKTGRTIPSSGGITIHGLDINSNVVVSIDSVKLAQALAASGVGTFTPQQKQLLDRMTLLQTLLDNVSAAATAEAKVVDLFHTAVSDDEFEQARSQSSRRLAALRQSLRDAIQQRLLSEGGAAASAQTRANADVRTLGFGDNDWPKLRTLIERELTAAQSAYKALAPNSGVSLELQAHLVPKQGTPSAIPLPGYNSVQPGPVQPYDKIRFEIPTDQRQLFDKFQGLAASAGEINGIGDAFLFALRSDIAVSPIQAQLDKVQADVESVKTLAKAVDSKSIDTWLKSLATNAVNSNTADTQLLGDVNKLAADVKAAKSTLTTLTDISGFATSVKSSTDGAAALDQILARFRAAGDLGSQVSAVAQSLQSLAPAVAQVKSSFNLAGVTPALKNALVADTSPFAPLLKEDGALPTLAADLKRLDEMVRTYFHAQTTATAVADFPVPEGQQRIPVEKDASTSFNLETIPQPRNPGDSVRLAYAFYTGTQQVASNSWNDTFDLRTYGLSDKVVASLALIRRISEEKFKPTAAMSWMLSYKPWPKTADDPPGSRTALFSGIGLTTMSLDFDTTETVELGIAPTVSFINDRILLGYGWNLQSAKDRTYAFFSIRLLSHSGMMGNGAN